MRGSLKRFASRGLLGAEIVVGALTLALFASSVAIAGTVSNDRPLIFSFDGSSSSIGGFTAPLGVATDESSGDVYVINGAGEGIGPGHDQERALCKFDAGGQAEDFSATGVSCLHDAFGTEGGFGVGAFLSDVAVDNSSVNPGRIYVSEEAGPIHAFAPDGTPLWTLVRASARPCGIAVDREGHLWVGNGSGEGEAGNKVLEFASTGSPPAQIGSVAITHGEANKPCAIGIDKSGKALYVSRPFPESLSGFDKYVDGLYRSSFANGLRTDVTVDQSKDDGHIFDVGASSFAENAPCSSPGCAGTSVPGSPFGGDLIGHANGIAYSPGKDWVYVSDDISNSVKVFGPPASGTVPDVSCQASDPVGLHSITAHCTINPLGLPNSYHFEWKEGAGASWGTAESSPLSSVEPSDGNPHEISLAITKYKGKQIRSNTSFQVRLAGTNTGNGLSAYSNADSPTTLVPPPAEVIKCESSAVTSESAHVLCTLDPKQEETSWRVLEKALVHGSQAECEALADDEFNTAKVGTVAPEEPGLVEVEADLTALNPAQFYCLRTTAANSGGGGKKDLSFRTSAIAPSEAGAAFAAPRTDTTARINARINPNGEADFTYRFEWSLGGGPWSALPLRESSIDGREPIVVADELSGLEPGAAYRYRLGLVENEAGPMPLSSLDKEKAFTTRTQAEVEAASPSSCPNDDVRATQHTAYLGACRGIELVNEPDKGNQTVSANGPGINDYTSSPMSANGEKVLWSVLAGAPGAPNGTEANFLARRSASGWNSESVAPPAKEQVGGGELAYLVNAASPGFGTFLFSARFPTKLSSPAPGAAVRVRERRQDILKQYTVQAPNVATEEAVDLSDDGEHLLALNPESPSQLEDIGAARVGPPLVDGETVSIMPDGSPSECGLDLEGKSFPGLLGSGIGHTGDHWIATNDASRVYFRAHPNKGEAGGGTCSGQWQLYVRDRDKSQTILIDAASPEFLTTSPDGHMAYFVTDSSLDPVDTDPNSADIYLWDEDAGAAGESSCLTCVLKGPGVTEGPAHLAKVGGLNRVRVSKDFSRIYFYSTSQVVEGAGKQGSLNLYMLSGEELHFVAETGGQDVLHEGADLSSDGKVLLFAAHATPSLTADAMAAQCISAAQGEAPGSCEELYRYEVDDESLECVSCRRGAVTTHSFGVARISITPDVRLSGDGSTAAFPTKEGLVGADVNQGTDLYEWRDGALHLITDGVSDFQEGVSAPWVWALDGDGSNILFGLVPAGGSLTGFEQDRVLNLYDARIGGGFEPPSAPVRCVEDSCQGPLQGAPAVDLPASAGFQGHGNPGAQTCRKGKVRRHGRCVKPRGKGKQQHKRTGHSKGGRGK